jgi:hypothetical protein
MEKKRHTGIWNLLLAIITVGVVLESFFFLIKDVRLLP